MFSLSLNLTHQSLQLIVEYEHKSTTSTTQDVGESALEEGRRSFLLGDLDPAVEGVLVHDIGLGTTGLHHHTSSDGIEWIGDDTGGCGYNLSDGPRDEDRGVLRVWQHSLGSIEATEVGSTIDDNTLDRHVEATVQTDHTVRLDGLLQTIDQTVVLTLGSGTADISAQSGTGEVKWVDEAQRGGTSGTTGSEVTQEVAPELCVLVDATQEDLFVHILEGEVQRLGWEVPDHVGKVTSPESSEALFFGDANKAIDDTFVLLVDGNLLGGSLHLEQQLDALDRGDGSLGHGSGDTSGQEILGEA